MLEKCSRKSLKVKRNLFGEYYSSLNSKTYKFLPNNTLFPLIACVIITHQHEGTNHMIY